MWNEWTAVARICRQEAKEEDRSGHSITAIILRAIADKLTQPTARPLQAIGDAHELIGWLPSPAEPIETRRVEAIKTAMRLPILDANAKYDFISQVRAKPGRPPVTRGKAARALEMHNTGISWSRIEKKLLPHRREAFNPGEDIRREVQHLKVVLKRHRISIT